MKVAHFCTFPHGGAATAALRHHGALLDLGIESRFYFHRNQSQVPVEASWEEVQFAAPANGGWTGALARRRQRNRQRRIYDLFNQHLAVRPPGHETFAMAELPEATPLDWRTIDADIVHLHWLSYFADYPSFFGSIPDSVPLVWTLHDTQFFTGGCHYTAGCQRFSTGCGHCPQVTGGGDQDVSRASWLAKQRALLNKDCRVTAPCQWMLDLAQKSPVWSPSTTFSRIEYGLDLEAYQPLPQAEARAALGLAPDVPLVAFGAMEVDNPRKGIEPLLGALSRLVDQPLECLAFGNGQLASDHRLPPIQHLGFLELEEQKRLVYAAADVVVVPSLEDNQPQVGLEALACGTPVVAFDTSGMPEYVQHEITGLLVPVGDELALASAIGRLIKDRRWAGQLGRQGRALTESRFERRQQTQRYVSLYRETLASVTTSRAA